MNIVLIGYRCCGKTSSGKRVAEKLDRMFVDTDELTIEKSGKSIDDIVSRYGWQHFRELEKDVIKEISSNDDLVIAAGGGVVTKKENIENLKKNGFFVWLYADVDIIKKRLEKDAVSDENRPSLTGDDPADEIMKVLEEREPVYSDVSDMAIDTSKLDIDEVADTIIERINKL